MHTDIEMYRQTTVRYILEITLSLCYRAIIPWQSVIDTPPAQVDSTLLQSFGRIDRLSQRSFIESVATGFYSALSRYKFKGINRLANNLNAAHTTPKSSLYSIYHCQIL